LEFSDIAAFSTVLSILDDFPDEKAAISENSNDDENFYYYRLMDSFYISSEISKIQELAQEETSIKATPSATSMICEDEPLAPGETAETTDTTPEISEEASVEPEVTPAPDVTMDISNVVFSEDILIHKGDTLDIVALIQERLMDLHYMDADEPTTFYGEVTHYAMQLFQRGHDLMVDGVAGYETLTLLFSEEKATPYLVRQGDYGFDIYVIKNRLIELGYLNDDDSGKKFDENTDYAVRIFQGRNKLSQDGIVGYNTTQVLFNGDAKPASNYTPPSSSSDSSSSGSSSSVSYDANSASDLVKYAKSCLDKGYTYVWGGKAPPGMDCSGFVYHCLNATGNTTGYMTSAAWAQSSYKSISSIHDVKAGDILCFSGHVAICIGNGKMIDSSSSSNTIRIANFESSSYWNRKWICGKRYFD
jgi:cell wall-associated NlpC family hydrolase